MRDIDAIRNAAGGVPKSGDTPWFTECGETNRQNGQTYRHFEMSRDGFSLLAMGWTGAKALAFKVAYIDRFNAMEAALKEQAKPALPDFSNPAIAARAWADQFEARLLAQRQADERAVRFGTAETMRQQRVSCRAVQ